MVMNFIAPSVLSQPQRLSANGAERLAPVPPFAKARVPAIVMVPVVVTGPPEKVRPVVPPETSIEVTVPVPEIVCHVGTPAAIWRTCPFDPAANTEGTLEALPMKSALLASEFANLLFI